MYKAQIEFTAYEDVYEDGEQWQCDNLWNDTLTADTPEHLKELVLDATYSKWEEVNTEQINSYDWCTEYHTSYLAIEDNQMGLTPPSTYEIDEWKQGREKLYSIHCHILVTKVTEEKAEL